MHQSVYFVFTKAPASLDGDTAERWHEKAARDLTAAPAVRAPRRFTMTADVGSISPIDYTHMALYTGPADGDARPFMPTVASGVPGPGEGRIASFHGHALEAPVDLDRLDHIYLVFTKPPPEVPVPEFYEWYATHMRENLTAEGFDAAWRYELERDVVDPLDPSDAVHAAIYEVHGELAQLRASLDHAKADGRVVFPAWFPGMALACLDCHAIARAAGNGSAG